jgi:hypothetical protein
MRILVLNPNTSESMTAEGAATANAVAAEATEIVARNPLFGASAIDAAAESYLSAVGVRGVVATMLGPTPTAELPASARSACPPNTESPSWNRCGEASA